METSLLIGNGLNQCLKGGVPWGNLLRAIAEDYGVAYNESISMPLEFERIINEILKKEPSYGIGIYDEVKQKVADKVCNVLLPTGAIHEALTKISTDAIMTTNYDFMLEKAFDLKFTPKSTALNLKYPWKETSEISNKKFFHVHGMASAKGTLCLGYEHYMGIVEKIRSELNAESKENSGKHIYCRLAGKEDFTGSWPERFYNTNIAIIGLGLYQCESDLWWLLTHRASLFYSNYNGIRSKNLLNNVITFYDVADDIPKNDESEEQKRKHRIEEQKQRNLMLHALNVNVHEEKLSRTGSYTEAYREIVRMIQRNGI